MFRAQIFWHTSAGVTGCKYIEDIRWGINVKILESLAFFNFSASYWPMLQKYELKKSAIVSEF